MQKNIEIDIIPKSFRLQWHITERCNFRCLHCYQEKYDNPEVSLEQAEEILKQFVALIKKWKIPPNFVNLPITGGEPFLFKNFFPFLEKIYKYSENYQWVILSNGSLLNRENAKILKHFNISLFQVSLEGLEKNNDEIRGPGSFKKTLEAIKILVSEGIITTVSFTVTKKNKDDIFPLAELLAEMGVKAFWIRRLTPWGQGSGLTDLLLKPLELLELWGRIGKNNFRFVKSNAFLQIMASCDHTFLKGDYCPIFKGNTLAVLPNGDVYPCRRLPIKIGNIFENTLEEIYYSDKIKELRDFGKTPDYCRKNCSNFRNCFGGARCVTYAYSGRLDVPDIQCPQAYRKLGREKIGIKEKLESLKEVIEKKINVC